MVYLYYTTDVDEESFEIFKLKNKQHLMRGLIKIGNEYQASQPLLNELLNVFDFSGTRKSAEKFLDRLIVKFDEELSMAEILRFHNMGFDIFIPHNFNVTSPLYMILIQFIGALKIAKITDYTLCDLKGDLICLA